MILKLALPLRYSSGAFVGSPPVPIVSYWLGGVAEHAKHEKVSNVNVHPSLVVLGLDPEGVGDRDSGVN